MNFLDQFNNALSLDEYKKLLGEQESVHNLHYKKVEIPRVELKAINLKILVITESWCGDSTAILPVIQKFFESQSAELRIALRDQNPKLIDQFLTNGARAIPVFLVLDSDGELLTSFGPRPRETHEIFEAHRSDIAEGNIEKMEVIKKIRTFYARDRGKAILNGFIAKLEQSKIV